jgi:hypothetical protein
VQQNVNVTKCEQVWTDVEDEASTYDKHGKQGTCTVCTVCGMYGTYSVQYM